MEIRSALPPVFDGLAPADRESALDRFRLVQIEAGVELIVEGEVDRTLVVVVSGELEVTDHASVVGRVRSGGLCGEMAFFANGVRRSSVTSVAESRLLILDRAGYDWFRRRRHPVAWALEDQALKDLTTRRRKVAERLAEVGPGTPLDRLVPPDSLLRRISGLFGAGGTFRPRLGRAKVLARSPLFDGARPGVLAELARHFDRFGARSGELICVEGQQGDELYVIATGAVDLLVSSRNDRVHRVATLGPGDAFGVGALVRIGEPRHATAVAHGPVTAVSLHKLRWADLAGRGDPVGSALRVAMIRALTEQLDFANELLARHDPGGLLDADTAFDAHGPFLVGRGVPPIEL